MLKFLWVISTTFVNLFIAILFRRCRWQGYAMLAILEWTLHSIVTKRLVMIEISGSGYWYISGDHTSIGFTHLTNLTFSESISFFFWNQTDFLKSCGVSLWSNLQHHVINSGAWEQIQLCWRAKDLFLKLIFWRVIAANSSSSRTSIIDCSRVFPTSASSTTMTSSLKENMSGSSEKIQLWFEI